MITRIYLFFTLALASAVCALAQPEVEAWGNIRGIRVEGHLFAFETSLQVVRPDNTVAQRTAHYANGAKFRREGDLGIVDVKLGEFACSQTVRSINGGKGAKVDVLVRSETEQQGLETCFAIDLPQAEFSAGSLQWSDASAGKQGSLSFADRSGRAEPLRIKASALTLAGSSWRLGISCGEPLELIVPVAAATEEAFVTVRIRLLAGSVAKGQSKAVSFVLEANGEIDRRQGFIDVDATRPGRAFHGVGGNFRLQFPASDPAIIDASLSQIRVAWSRIALWWRDWDSEEGADPLRRAREGQVTKRQLEQMALAQRLARSHIPVIVSAWDPPEWGTLKGPKPKGIYSDLIDPAKWDRLTTSIADYLLYLKESQGVEAVLFSFNEVDLGLVPTPAEHIGLLKKLGRAFAERGLATKILLADTSNATPHSLQFVEAAMHDLEARVYVGAIGFHTWGGCENVNLVRWGEAARQLGLPLLVTEAGPDAEAHKYPDVFLEPHYQLDESELYVRICALSQPATIMEWQLTADYSVFKGGGAYGHEGPLVPTQRFWGLKQLGTTPAGSFALPVRADRPALTCAAFVGAAGGDFYLHVVNTGAGREMVLRGLPSWLRTLKPVVTDATRGMVEQAPVKVEAGQATVFLDGVSFITFRGERVHP